MNKDRLYLERMREIPPFEFNEEVAEVFDDMASRSIPYYRLVEEMTADLVLRFYKPSSRIYDLGCSTGTTLELLCGKARDKGVKHLELIGMDNSSAMCQRARQRLQACTDQKSFSAEVLEQDVAGASFPRASAVILNYTLQFVSPFFRRRLLKKIHEDLFQEGILIVSDKTLQSSPEVSRVFSDNYYRFKRSMGYSELEISRKREALENVLIPYRVEEERDLLLDAGFNSVDVFFSWYNFSSFLCVKREGPKK
jgi:tRNA (cmo5U34)-methyltransferase